MNIRVRIGKNQMAQGKSIDGTIVYDHDAKAQLLFPTTLKFPLGAEIVIQSGNVAWSGKL